MTFQCSVLSVFILGNFLEFGDSALEALDMGLLSFPEGSLGSPILRFSFLNTQSESYAPPEINVHLRVQSSSSSFQASS